MPDRDDWRRTVATGGDLTPPGFERDAEGERPCSYCGAARSHLVYTCRDGYVSREQCKREVEAALAAGELRGREQGKRDGLALALEALQVAASGYVGIPRARELAARVEARLRSLLDAHPAPWEGDDW
jgi:hypothetical protein